MVRARDPGITAETHRLAVWRPCQAPRAPLCSSITFRLTPRSPYRRPLGHPRSSSCTGCSWNATCLPSGETRGDDSHPVVSYSTVPIGSSSRTRSPIRSNDQRGAHRRRSQLRRHSSSSSRGRPATERDLRQRPQLDERALAMRADRDRHVAASRDREECSVGNRRRVGAGTFEADRVDAMRFAVPRRRCRQCSGRPARTVRRGLRLF